MAQEASTWTGCRAESKPDVRDQQRERGEDGGRRTHVGELFPTLSAVHPQPQDGRTSRRLPSSSGLSPRDEPLPIEVAVAIAVVLGRVSLGHHLSLLHRELFERLLLLLRWRQVRVRVVDILRVGRDLSGGRRGLVIKHQQEIGGGVGRSCEGKDERAKATTHLWNSPLLPDGRVLLQQG